MDGFMCRLCVNLTYRQTKAVLVIYPYFTATQSGIGYTFFVLSSTSMQPTHDENQFSGSGSVSFWASRIRIH
jgi:hypothetical protein